MQASVTIWGDVLLTPESDSERFVLRVWREDDNMDLFIKNSSDDRSLILGRWDEHKAYRERQIIAASDAARVGIGKGDVQRLIVAIRDLEAMIAQAFGLSGGNREG